MTGNRADAAELMQDAFLKLWERWDTIDRIDDPTAYLFRVALNGSRMRARAARRAARRMVAPPSSSRPVRRDRHPRRRSTPVARTDAAPAGRLGPARSVRLRLRRGGDASWASAHRPFARSPPKGVPSCGPPEVHMAELRTVFEMATTQIEPDRGRMEPAGRTAPACRTPPQGRGLGVGSRDRGRIALFASVALDRARDGTLPAIPPGSRSAPTFTIVGTDGSIVATILGFDGAATPDLSPDGTTIAFTIHDWSIESADRHDASGRHGIPHPHERSHRREAAHGGHRTGPNLLYFRTGRRRQPPADGDGRGWVRTFERSRERIRHGRLQSRPNGHLMDRRSSTRPRKDHAPILATIPVTGGRTALPQHREPAGRRSVVPGRPTGARSRSRAGYPRWRAGSSSFEVWVMNADGSGEPSSGCAARSERRSSRVVTGWKQGRLHRDHERDLSQWRRPVRDRHRDWRDHRGPPRDGDRPSPREPADLDA